MIDKVKLLQERELAILIKIDELFREYNIKYFLAYGTVLGCVRHSGFIPWDDDIDIFVFGRDLPKVKEIFRSVNTGFLRLDDYDTAKNYPYSFPKIVDNRTSLKEDAFKLVDYKCGAYVDIFPLFDISDNIFKRFFSEKLRYVRHVMLRYYYIDVKGRALFVKIFHKILEKTCKIDHIQDKLYKTYIRESCNGAKYAEPNIFLKKSYLPKSMFDNSVRMLFEGNEFPIPIDYDKFLKIVYGDYMKLPSVEKRKSTHIMCELMIDGKNIE